MSDMNSNGVHERDYAEICDMLSRIARAVDLASLEEYLSLLTDDIVFEFPEMPQLGLPAKTYTGHEAVGEGVVTRRAAGLQGPGSHTLHLVSTVTVARVDETSVRAKAYWTYYSDTQQVPQLRSMGEYDNLFRREDGEWKLAHRRISTY